MRDYFVTGGTGAVGSALVPILLEDPTARVRLLIRANSREQLASRLDELFRFWNLGDAESDARSRIAAMAGDVTLVRFGLDSESYEGLARRCTHIVHAAGSVRMNLPIEEARRSSVCSAQNVVALAELCRKAGQFEKLEFVSTVGVAGRRPGVLPEVWLDEPRAFHNTYEQAKAEAEHWLRSQVARTALPVTVHRPSMVVGDSRTGHILHFQVFYHLCEFLSGLRTRGVVPTLGNTSLDIVPVDYVARLIDWSSRAGETSGRILHACSGPLGAIRLADLQQRVRDAFCQARIDLPAIEEVSLGTFRDMLTIIEARAPTELRKAIAAMPVFLDYLEDNQAFANAETVAIAARHGIAVPNPNAFLDMTLNAYLEATRSLSMREREP